MRAAALLIAVASTVLDLAMLRGPINELQQRGAQINAARFAVDLAVPINVNQAKCMMRNGYSVIFMRLYAPYQSGVADPHACDNIRNALSAGVIISGYMTPEPNSVKTGAEQFDEMYTNLKNNQIYLRNIWIQVTSPINWSANTTVNINFVNSILFRAEQNGINTGIFTNFYDWSQIMGAAAVSNASLWYWNTYGAGESNETPPIFEDFRPFGGWTQPTIKQFAQVETVCGAIVNRDVFVPSESVGGVVRGIEDRNALSWSLAEERIIPRKSTN